MSDLERHIETLAKKAAESPDGIGAQQFAQAALNLANALCSVGSATADRIEQALHEEEMLNLARRLAEVPVGGPGGHEQRQARIQVILNETFGVHLPTDLQ